MLANLLQPPPERLRATVCWPPSLPAPSSRPGQVPSMYLPREGCSEMHISPPLRLGGTEAAKRELVADPGPQSYVGGRTPTPPRGRPSAKFPVAGPAQGWLTPPAQARIKGDAAGSPSHLTSPELGHALTSTRPHSCPPAPGRGHRFPPTSVGITNRKLGHAGRAGLGTGRRGREPNPGLSSQLTPKGSCLMCPQSHCS